MKLSHGTKMLLKSLAWLACGFALFWAAAFVAFTMLTQGYGAEPHTTASYLTVFVVLACGTIWAILKSVIR